MPSDAPPLTRLSALEQSVWVDFLSRESIRGGHLQELIDEYSVVGATSNPTIFEKAMSSGDAYDEQLHELAARGQRRRRRLLGAGRTGHQGCVRPLPPGVGRRTGCPPSPRRLRVARGRPAAGLRHAETYSEAIRIHKSVDRPNLMVKIPATKPGLAAIEDVIAKGHSINVTLIFSLRRYAEVAESYIRGLERLVAEGGDPGKVASVASFFVSRIDTEADRRLDEVGAPKELKGKLAIANAKLAYAHYLEAFAGPRWELPRSARAPRRSGCCGPRRRRRTPTTRTRCTWTS